MPIAGEGNITVLSHNGEHAVMKHVLHVPTAKNNLLSISRFADHGLFTIFTDTQVLTFPANLIQGFVRSNIEKSKFKGFRDGNLYKFRMELAPSSANSPVSLMASIATRSFHDWHLALNHLNSNSLKRLASMVHGMNFKDKIHNDCIACMTGNLKASMYLEKKAI
jgi:hypothetical protein